MIVAMHGGNRAEYWDVYEAAWVPCPDMDESDREARDERAGDQQVLAEHAREQDLATPEV